MRIGKHRTFIVAVILFSTILSQGCGKTEEQKESYSKAYDAKYISLISSPWKMSSSEPEELAGWDAVECFSGFSDLVDGEHAVSEMQFVFSKNVCYGLIGFMDRSKGWTCPYDYVVTSIDLVTGARRKLTMNLKNLDTAGLKDKKLKSSFEELAGDEQTRLNSFDVYDGKIILFFMKSDEEHERVRVMAATVSMEGQVLKLSDYGDDIPTDYNKGYEEYWEYPKAIGLEGDGLCLYYEGAGRLMGLDKDRKELFVTGENSLKALSYLGREAGGNPLFSCMGEGNNNEFFYINKNGKETLYSGNIGAEICAPDMYGNILLYNGYKLMSWDVSKGKVDCLFKFDELLSECPVGNFECMGLSRGNEGDVLACFVNRYMGQILCYRLNDREKPEKTELFVLTDGEYQKVEWAARDYERTHVNVKITIEDMRNGQFGRADDYAWLRVAQDVKKGKGPDLIITLADRLRNLSDMICPLDDIMPSELKNNVFEGILDCGKNDGKQLLIPLDPRLEVLMVNREYYDKDTWTLKELLDAYDRAKGEKGEDLRFLGLNYDPSPYQLLYTLCLSSLDHSSFVDIDSMTCDFENEEFYRLLQFCCENGVDYSKGDPRSFDEADVKAAALNGEVFLYLSSGGLATFSRDMRDLSDTFKCVGNPSKDGIGSLVSGYNGIALSEHSKNKETAADFMFSLFEDDFQDMYFTDNWARKDYLRSHVKDADQLYVYTAEGTEHPNGPAVLCKASNTPIAGKKDGTSYLEEFIDLMDSGTAASVQTDIQDIIEEEAEACFAGEKTAEEVAHIIQSRVKIYLDEGK